MARKKKKKKKKKKKRENPSFAKPAPQWQHSLPRQQKHKKFKLR